MKTVEVIAHKASMAKFSVPAGSRKEIEQAIEHKLRSDKELVWQDNSEGINAVCFTGDDVWRPRKRFFPTENDGDE